MVPGTNEVLIKHHLFDGVLEILLCLFIAEEMSDLSPPRLPSSSVTVETMESETRKVLNLYNSWHLTFDSMPFPHIRTYNKTRCGAACL